MEDGDTSRGNPTFVQGNQTLGEDPDLLGQNPRIVQTQQGRNLGQNGTHEDSRENSSDLDDASPKELTPEGRGDPRDSPNARGTRIRGILPAVADAVAVSARSEVKSEVKIEEKDDPTSRAANENLAQNEEAGSGMAETTGGFKILQTTALCDDGKWCNCRRNSFFLWCKSYCNTMWKELNICLGIPNYFRNIINNYSK